MKNNTLIPPQYLNIIQQFEQWLQLIGLQAKSAKHSTVLVKDLFLFIQKNQLQLDGEAFSLFFQYLLNRPNLRKPGGLSKKYINKYTWALKLFIEFLDLNLNISIHAHLPKLKTEQSNKQFLALQNINKLYRWIKHQSDKPCFDRAILAIFYAAGLRRTEGAKLLIQHFKPQLRIIKVINGKGAKHRIVPIHKNTVEHINQFIYNARLKPNKHTPQFLFISSRGNAMSSCTFERRLFIWTQVLKLDFNITLHTLRHSIATHLMQKGMDLQLIQQFLGHHSLASTQIYTHLA